MMFQLEDVTVELGGRVVLSDLSLSIAAGERVVLLGINGCGKTTLLKLLDGLVAPTKGIVRYEGELLDQQLLRSAEGRRRFRSEVGLVMQNVDAMLFNTSVADEIAFGPRQLGGIDLGERTRRWAETFDITSLLDRPPFDLSGGEKKRVALAAVLALQPRAVLLDEVTAHLDPASCARLIDVLEGLPETSVIAATHNLSVAGELGARALLLAPHRPGLLFDGPVEQLIADEALLVESGLAHRHVHHHGAAAHTHFHVHDGD